MVIRDDVAFNTDQVAVKARMEVGFGHPATLAKISLAKSAGLTLIPAKRPSGALRGIKDSTGQYIVNADPTADAVFRLFGAPVTVSKRVPNKTTGSGENKTTTGRAALVDFSQIAVARDMTPTVTALQERYADYDQVGLRVITRYDAAPLNPEAIVALEGITRG